MASRLRWYEGLILIIRIHRILRSTCSVTGAERRLCRLRVRSHAKYLNGGCIGWISATKTRLPRSLPFVKLWQ